MNKENLNKQIIEGNLLSPLPVNLKFKKAYY